jgi:alanyl-tRNA synthetase
LVEGLRQSLKAAEANRREAEIELNRYRARERHQATHPDAQGRRRVVERRERGALEELRGLAQAVIELPKSVFVGAVADPPAVLLAASADSGVDAGATLKPILTAAGGKGGGSARLAQGSLPNLESLEAVLKTLQA